ncbi:MAG TPA: HhH-GPD-type base excision DNA repair protein [Mycobacteriales bacterium]|nr:HhH-GPD-type base excision DNA repair protein [Mycobacteriales bacterium]
MTPRKVHPRLVLAQDEQADALLGAEPLALLIGLVLDQQVPMEKAFRGPYDLSRRLGKDLDAAAIAGADPEELAATFSERPALHRFPAAMAKRVQAMCTLLVQDYGGDARRLWSDGADGTTVLRRIKKLPGFGDQKAKITLALLGKQYGVTPEGWREAAGELGAEGVHLSIADITDDASYAAVRAHKREMKAGK